MTKRTQQWQKRARLPLAVAIATGMAAPAGAFTFNYGDVDGAFDTTLTAAAGWRTESQDSELIAQGNQLGSSGGASSNNYDDGNLNFKSGDTYSKVVKGTSELYLNQDFRGEYLSRVGGFVRGRYWYDFELKDENRAVDELGQRRELNPEAKDEASGGELLDAYVWTDWYLGDIPVSIRYGNQVFNWGESTFIQGGINTTNPIDVGAIRAPGSEVRDALLPVEALYTSIGITESVTLEAYAQFDWEPTEIDDCGTFFSTNDFTADGCGPVLINGAVSDRQNVLQGPAIERLGDRRPDGEDQFGVALQWYSPELGNTEFGLYHVRYHSRLPYISGQVAESRGGLPSYFVEYPEDIKLYGISMNTNIPGGWSVGAEYSFRENMPLQWNAFELISGGQGQPYSRLFQKRTEGNVTFGDLAGEAVDGFDRHKVSQAQATFIKFFDRVMGASRLTFVGEVGMNYIHDLPSEARYGRSGIWGIGEFDGENNKFDSQQGQFVDTSCSQENINSSNCTNDGFVTDFSWGYRLSTELTYNNAIAGATLKPSLSWSHDVQGYSPAPGGAFNEGSKAIGLGLTAEYRDQYEAGIQYTNYFGGDYNAISDRDHISANVSYSF